MNKISTYLFHSFSLLELKKCFLGAAHQRLLLGLKQCREGWSSVIVSSYIALVLGSGFSNIAAIQFPDGTNNVYMRLRL